MPPANTARRSTFAALQHRNFRIFYFGHILSLSGTWLQVTALGWLVLDLTDSELWLGIINAGTSLPILVLSLFAGVAADRVDKRSILIAAQWVAFAQALVLGLLTHFGMLNVGTLFALALVLGISNAFEVPTRQSFFVELVGERDLANAIALNSSAFNGTRMVGPAIAGVLISTVGIAACFFANAASYLAVILGLFAIRRPPPSITEPTGSALSDIREGFQWILHNRTALGVIMFLTSASVLVLPFTMLLPVYARDILQAGPQGLGWLYSATGAGAVAGGLALARMAHKVSQRKLLPFTITSLCIFVSAFALSTNFFLSLVFLTCAGFSMILSTATANSLMQTTVPNALRGRVMSVYVVMFLGTTPIGYLQAGTMARIFGAPTALVLGSATLLTLLLCFLWRSARVREAV